MQIHVSGRVSACQCAFTRRGVPVLQLELADQAGQTVRVTHDYPDASLSSQHAARALAGRLRGQHIELDLVECRFRARRLDARAPVIHPPSTDRKDLS